MAFRFYFKVPGIGVAGGAVGYGGGGGGAAGAAFDGAGACGDGSGTGSAAGIVRGDVHVPARVPPTTSNIGCEWPVEPRTVPIAAGIGIFESDGMFDGEHDDEPEPLLIAFANFTTFESMIPSPS